MCTVEVKGLRLETAEDTIVFYFENIRSGGGPINEIQHKPELRWAAVTFEDAETVQRVLARKHTLDGHRLEVCLYTKSPSPMAGKTVSMVSESSDYECPVCHDDYVDPKILPCGHLVCQQCVLSWLDKEGREAGCPLCRASIIPSSSAASPADFAAEVSALPTDLHTADLVHSHQVLGGRGVCGLCENNFAAVFYCIQCSFKLCRNCEKVHRKIPSTKHHSLEDLNNLDVESLARSRHVMCKAHPDRLAELYCPAHEQLICALCGSTGHGACAGRKTLAKMAADTRAELDQRVQKLRMKETQMVKQFNSTKAHFQSKHKEAQDMFDDLQKAFDTQRHRLTSMIQAEEDSCLRSLAPTEKTRAALTQNATAVERVVQSASEGSLLQMHQSLRARLDDLENQSNRSVEIKLKDFVLARENLKREIVNLGFVSALSGPEQANLLKVGDRVMRGKDWDYSHQDGDPPGPGTVTEIRKSGKKVNVLWDCGHQNWYRMGAFDKYDLQLCAVPRL
ncbi:uncharacterized protein LOC143296000 [Babylonia areolata]|uniref:uncharacterized protein LOC143296000 n=1 Tax=Babylonia areolata TaxID=304850 RepID=UPI003FCF40EC